MSEVRMMSEVTRMLDQLDRAYRADAWHGSAVLETLDGVTAEQAAARPIAGAHSIWELAEHIAIWKEIVATRLGGTKESIVDWQPIEDTSAAAWKKTLARLEAAHVELKRVVEAFPESRLDQPPLPKASKAYVQIHGAIQHDLYHAGQIALLRKAL
jgi:uncharacterized damage-inducible protein DinB